MGFLDYSNQTHSNIIPKEEFESLTQEVFNVIAENISKSLGPLGSSATILDGMLTTATKDGYSILKKYRFHNRYKKMIYNLIMTPCTKMNNTVGDGTTTAIALTNAMFNEYMNIKDKTLSTLYRLPRQFTQAWDKVINDIIERIKMKSIQIDTNDIDMIYNLAYVTSNGNEDVSNNISDIYRTTKNPSIKQKDSPTNKSYISAIDGFDFPANLISDVYIKNQDMSTVEENITILLFDYKIESDIFNDIIMPINDVMRCRSQKLLILAPSYDKLMCNTIVDQYTRKEFMSKDGINLMLAQYSLGKLSKDQLSDLAVMLRTKVIDQELTKELSEKIHQRGESVDKAVEKILEDPECPCYRFIGVSASAWLSCNNGSIFRVDGIEEDEVYKSTLRKAKQDLEDLIAEVDNERQSYSVKIYNATNRISQLEMRNFIYYIGADSYLQKQILWDSVEDVIKCLKSALKYGIVPGCQITIMRICNEMANELLTSVSNGTDKEDHNTLLEKLSTEDKLRYNIINIIYISVIRVYSQILHGPDGMGVIKLLPRWQYTSQDGVDALQKEAIEKGNNIINESIISNKVFDIETLEYNSDIITSAETDIMVLTVASELVKILISGNQCIFLDSDINESHQEDKDIYV